jgi:hypothetical protein
LIRVHCKKKTRGFFRSIPYPDDRIADERKPLMHMALSVAEAIRFSVLASFKIILVRKAEMHSFGAAAMRYALFWSNSAAR